MIVVVKTPFVGTVDGRTFNMPAPGTRLDVTDHQGEMLLGMGVVDPLVTKVLPMPEEVKKKRPSES